MMVLVTYDVDYNDVSSAKRLRKIAKICENFGVRVQKSVFEMLVEPEQFITLRNRLLKEMDSKKDSIRFYMLGKNWERKVEHYGVVATYEQGGTIML